MENEKKMMTPTEFFDFVKSQKSECTDEMLINLQEMTLDLIHKYNITGQKKGLNKLIFHYMSLQKEREVVKEGIDKFVYRSDIDKFIDEVDSKVIKIIELENYEREIPDEIVEALSKVKDKFDKFYILFTDYTGKIEKQIDKERRDKDPILFGTFVDENVRAVCDRFYYIGDWVDEHCDLTLDKFVSHFDNTNRKVVRTINTPKDIIQLQEQLSKLTPSNKIGDRFEILLSGRKNSFSFSKVTTFFKKMFK